jgi:hypothetical protein
VEIKQNNMKKWIFTFALIVSCNISNAQIAETEPIDLAELIMIARAEIRPARTHITREIVKTDTIYYSNKFRIQRFRIQRQYYTQHHYSYHTQIEEPQILSKEMSVQNFKNPFYKYIADNLHYPDSSIFNKRDRGRVLVLFKIDSDCNIKDVEIIRAFDDFVKQEVLSVLQSIPQSILQEADVFFDENVRYNVSCNKFYFMPITFILDLDRTIEIQNPGFRPSWRKY